MCQLCEERSPIPAPAISLIPLDDRPCNRLFPQQLAAIAGCEIRLPPRLSLGCFTTPGDCEAIATWLRDLSPERLVVSLDMLCYGGLVASRTPQTGLAQALVRLGALRHLRQSRPEAVIFGFSTIMRLGTTVTRAAALDDHLRLRSYSQLLDRAERLGDPQARSDLAELANRLDPTVLHDYLAARRRNHAVNRAAIELAAEGVLDYLVLAQEDAAPVGIHIPEQLALRGQMEELRTGARVALCPGADEIGLVLLARQVLLGRGISPSLAVDYATSAGAEVVPEFESQPLRQTAQEHVLAAGATLCMPGEADALLFVHTPIGSQPDVFEAPPPGQSPSLALQADSVAERVRAASEAGYLVGLADLAYCNGADPELMAALRRADALPGLGAFAAWNTAANTIGTVISQLCLMAATTNPDQAAVRDFLLIRLLDDHCYQSSVRRKALAYAQSIGADPFDLRERAPELERFVKAELLPLAHDFYSAARGPEADAAAPAWRVSLPWNRLFEVELALSSD